MAFARAGWSLPAEHQDILKGRIGRDAGLVSWFNARSFYVDPLSALNAERRVSLILKGNGLASTRTDCAGRVTTALTLRREGSWIRATYRFRMTTGSMASAGSNPKMRP